MSAVDPHRVRAERALSRLPGCEPEDSTAFASEATASALLAVEARLGEMVAQQRLMTAINLYVTGAGNLSGIERDRLREFITSHVEDVVQD